MNARVLPLLLLLLWAWSVGAEARLEAPKFPPKDWNIFITIELYRDVAETFFDPKPARDDDFYVGPIRIWLRSDGALVAPKKNPILTGKRPANGLIAHEFVNIWPMAYVPLTDQKLIYESAVKAVNSFAQDFTPKRKEYPLTGIDVSLDLAINGEDDRLRYCNLQPQNPLPKNLLAVLAPFRRNLTAEYARLFDFLKVPKLPSLPSNEANKFAKCLLHNEWMKVDEIPIYYGLPGPRPNYWQAAQKLFPEAHISQSGGCVTWPTSPRSTKALYCPACRLAEKEWVKENELSK